MWAPAGMSGTSRAGTRQGHAAATAPRSHRPTRPESGPSAAMQRPRTPHGRTGARRRPSRARSKSHAEPGRSGRAAEEETVASAPPRASRSPPGAECDRCRGTGAGLAHQQRPEQSASHAGARRVPRQAKAEARPVTPRPAAASRRSTTRKPGPGRGHPGRVGPRNPLARPKRAVGRSGSPKAAALGRPAGPRQVPERAIQGARVVRRHMRLKTMRSRSSRHRGARLGSPGTQEQRSRRGCSPSGGRVKRNRRGTSARRLSSLLGNDTDDSHRRPRHPPPPIEIAHEESIVRASCRGASCGVRPASSRWISARPTPWSWSRAKAWC